MNRSRCFAWNRVLAVLLIVLLVLSWGLGVPPAGRGERLPAAQAAGHAANPAPVAAVIPTAIHTVCPAGPPTCDYSTIQEAVDAAGAGDIVKVATGVYDDLHSRPAPPGYIGPVTVTQVVYLTKTLTLRGGYDTTFADPPDPVANPTTLDAQGQGRALFVVGAVSPAVAGLRLTGGNAAGLGGGTSAGRDSGGGVYLLTATAALSNSYVFSNTAMDGGGIYLRNTAAVLEENAIFSNTAQWGGGLYLWTAPAIVSGNVVTNNVVSANGGALHMRSSDATIIGNTFAGNRAQADGGALHIYFGTPTVSDNAITANTAGGFGGGITMLTSLAAISGNLLAANTSARGGGLYLTHSDAPIQGNTIHDNLAYVYGGGMFYQTSDPILSANAVTSNTAGLSGGGLYALASGGVLTNNVIAGNTVNGTGTALTLVASDLRMWHTTIARNHGGDGRGVAVLEWCAPGCAYSTVTMTDTILVSHTVGLYAPAGNSAFLEATLWGSGPWANETDWAGAGLIVTGTVNLWAAPAFVAPDAWNYHITQDSGALDAGVDAGVFVDIDGQARPAGPGFDIGADELWATLRVVKGCFPNPVAAGAPLTYTLRLTNTGYVTLNAAIADTLPAHVTPTGVLTWAVQLPLDGVWNQTVTVTVESGYGGLLTNVVRAGSPEGATGAYTCVVVADNPVAGLAAFNDSPTALGNPTTLTATLAAGTALTCTWNLGDGSPPIPATCPLPLVPSSITHTYPAAGIYTAVVTASNAVSLLTATTVVTVEEALAGLAAFNDSPTALGNPTTLTATLAAGAALTCTWEMGDGSPPISATCPLPLVPSSITYTYPAVGVYTAMVTAANHVGLLTATTVVTVEEALAGLAAFNDSPTALGNPTTLTATLTAGAALTCTWNLGDGSPPIPATCPLPLVPSSITHTYPAAGTYTAVITASNILGRLVASTVVTVLSPPPVYNLYLPLIWRGDPPPLHLHR